MHIGWDISDIRHDIIHSRRESRAVLFGQGRGRKFLDVIERIRMHWLRRTTKARCRERAGGTLRIDRRFAFTALRCLANALGGAIIFNVRVLLLFILVNAQRTRSGSLCIIETILERLVKLIVFDDFNGGIIRILSLTLAGNGFLGAWALTFLLAPGALRRLKRRGRAKSRPYIRLQWLLF